MVQKIIARRENGKFGVWWIFPDDGPSGNWSGEYVTVTECIRDQTERNRLDVVLNADCTMQLFLEISGLVSTAGTSTVIF